MKKIAIYSATRGKKEECALYKSVTEISKYKCKDIKLEIKENNTEGLSKNYNSFLFKEKYSHDYIVFAHDDVFIDDYNLIEKLEFAHETVNLDIVGLAGGLEPKISEPALWHLMCGGFESYKLRGAVAHPCSRDQVMVTTFGPTPSRVTILDGLFLSVKTRSLKDNDWKFNENYNFHHYDIASCIDANKKKLKLGVFPIWVVHHSPGLLSTHDENFQKSQAKFLLEYGG